MRLGEISIDVALNQQSVNTTIDDLKRQVQNLTITIKPTFDKSGIKDYQDALSKVQISNLSIANSGKAGESITKPIVDSVKGLGKDITQALKQELNPINYVADNLFQGIFQGIGTEVSESLSKGLKQGIESAVAPAIGSLEFLGETIVQGTAPAIGNKIKSALPPKLAKNIEAAFKLLKNQTDEPLREIQKQYQSVLGEDRFLIAQKGTEGTKRSNVENLRKQAIKEAQLQYRQIIVNEPALEIRRKESQGKITNQIKNLESQRENLADAIDAGTATDNDVKRFVELNQEIDKLKQNLEDSSSQLGKFEQVLQKLGANVGNLRAVRQEFEEISAGYGRYEIDKVNPARERLSEAQQRKDFLQGQRTKALDQAKDFIGKAQTATTQEDQDIYRLGAKKRIGLADQINEEISKVQADIDQYAEAIKAFEESVAKDFIIGRKKIQSAQIELAAPKATDRENIVKQRIQNLSQFKNTSQDVIDKLESDRDTTIEALDLQNTKRDTLGSRIDALKLQPQSTDTDVEIARLEREYQDMSANAAELEKSIAEFNENIDRVKAYFDQIDKTIGQEQNRLAEIKTQAEKTSKPSLQGLGVDQSIAYRPNFKPIQARPANLPQAYSEILDEVVKRSDFQGLVNIPTVSQFTEEQKKRQIEKTGQVATATYSSGDNTIYLNDELHQRLTNNQLTEKDVEFITHELRHAVQSAFGQIDISKQLNQSLNLLSPTSEEARKLALNIEGSSALHSESAKPLVRKYEKDAYTFAERNAPDIYAKVERNRTITEFEKTAGVLGGGIDFQLGKASREAVKELGSTLPEGINKDEVFNKFKDAYNELKLDLKPLIEDARKIDELDTNQIEDLRKSIEISLENAIAQLKELPKKVIADVQNKQQSEADILQERMLSPMMNKNRVLVPLARELGIETRENGKMLTKKELVSRMMTEVPHETLRERIPYTVAPSPETRELAEQMASLHPDELRSELSERRQQITQMVSSKPQARNTSELQQLSGEVEQEYEAILHALTLDISDDTKNILTAAKLNYDKLIKKVSSRILENLNQQSQPQAESNIQGVGEFGAFNIKNPLESLRELFYKAPDLDLLSRRADRLRRAINSFNEKLKEVTKQQDDKDNEIFENPNVLIEILENSLNQFDLDLASLEKSEREKILSVLSSVRNYNQVAVKLRESGLSEDAEERGTLSVPDSVISRVFKRNEPKVQFNPFENLNQFKNKTVENSYENAKLIVGQVPDLANNLQSTEYAQRKLGQNDIANELKGIRERLQADTKAIENIISKPIDPTKFNELDKLQNRIKQVFTEFKQPLDDGSKISDDFSASLLRGADTIKGFLTTVGGFFTIKKAIDLLKEFAPAIREAAVETERTRASFQSLTGSVVQGDKSFERVRNQAQNLGQDFISSAQEYTNFSSQLKGSTYEGSTNALFSGLQKAGIVAQLTPDRMSQLYQSIGMGMSGDTLNSGDIQQLAFALPSASSTASRTLGLTPQQFSSYAGKGVIDTDNFYSKFGQQLSADAEKDLPSAMDSSTAVTNRYNNAIQQLQATLGKLSVPVENTGIKALTFALEQLIKVAPAVEIFGAMLAVSWGVNLGKGLLAVANNFGLVEMGLNGILTASKLALPALGNLALKFVGIAAAIEVFKLLKTSISDASGELRTMADESEKNLNNFKKLNSEITGKKEEKPKFESEDSLLVDGTFLGGILPKSKKSGAEDDFFANILYYTRRGLTKGEEGYAKLFGNATYADKVAFDRTQSAIDLGKTTDQTNNFINGQLSDKNSFLGKVSKADSRLEDIQSQRRSILAMNPSDSEGLSKLAEQEQEILKQREESIKPIAALQSSSESNIANLRETIKTYQELASHPGDYQQLYTQTLVELQAKLKEAEKTQASLNQLIRQSIDEYVLFTQRIELANSRLKDNQAQLKINVANSKTQVANSRQSAGLSSEQANFLGSRIETESLSSQVELTRRTLAEMANLLNGQANILSKYKITENTGSSEATYLASQTTGKDKTVLEKFAEYKDLEANYADLKQQLSESNANINEQLKQARIAVLDYFKEIQIQSAQVSIEASAARNEIALNQAKGKLKTALLGHQESFASSYVDALIGFLDALNKPIQDMISAQQGLIQQYSQTNQQIVGLRGMVMNAPIISGLGTENLNQFKNKNEQNRTFETTPEHISSVRGSSDAKDFSEIGNHHLGNGYYQKMFNGKLETFVNRGGNELLVKDVTLSDNQGNTNVPVASPAMGIAHTKFQEGGAGQYVTVTNDQGEQLGTVMHLKKFLVRDGEKVQYGQALGIQGGEEGQWYSGHSEGTHAHIELRPQIAPDYFNSTLTGRFGTSTNLNTQNVQTQLNRQIRGTQTGEASFYRDPAHDRLNPNPLTKTGELYNENGLTGASNSLPMNTIVRITNTKNGKVVFARVNDTGDFSSKTYNNRIFDGSLGVAKALGYVDAGHTDVKIDNLGKGTQQDVLSLNQTLNQYKNIPQVPMSNQVKSGVFNSNFQIANEAELSQANRQILDNYSQNTSVIRDRLASSNKLSEIEQRLAKDKAERTLKFGLRDQDEQVIGTERNLENVSRSTGWDTPSKAYKIERQDVNREFVDMNRNLIKQLEQLEDARDTLKEMISAIEEGGFQGADQLKDQLPKLKAGLLQTSNAVDRVSRVLDNADKVRQDKLRDIDKKFNVSQADLMSENMFQERRKYAEGLTTQAERAEVFQHGNPGDLSQGDPVKLRSEADKINKLTEYNSGLLELEKAQRTGQIVDPKIAEKLRSQLEEIKNLNLSTNDEQLRRNLEKRTLEVGGRDISIRGKQTDYESQKAELLAQQAEYKLQANPDGYERVPQPGMMRGLKEIVSPQRIRLQNEISIGQFKLDSDIQGIKQFAFDTGLSNKETKQLIDNVKELDSLKLNNLRIQMRNLTSEQLRQYRDKRTQNQQKLIQSEQDLRGGQADFYSVRGFTVGSDQIRKQSTLEQQRFEYAQGVRDIYQYARASHQPVEETQKLLDNLNKLNQLKLDNIKAQFDPWNKVATSAIGGIQSGIEGLLTNTENFSQAFQNLGSSVAKTLAQLASQWLTNDLFKNFFGNPTQRKTTTLGAGSVKGIGGLFNSLIGDSGEGNADLGGAFSLLGMLGFKEGGLVQNFAEGGNALRYGNHSIGYALRREGSNSVIAALTPGERVLNLKETQAYQSVFPQGILKAMNRQTPNFNNGGGVNLPSMSNVISAMGNSYHGHVSLDMSSMNNPENQLKADQIAKVLKPVVVAELKRQTRPGGILNK